MKNKTFALIAIVLLIIIAIALLEKSHVQPTSLGEGKIEVETSNSSQAKIKETLYPRAIELAKPNAIINGENITLSGYVGKKVVLIDFWTYSCINCLRTLPYVTSWYEKYKDEGLVILGVHSPEFEFEKDLTNVQNAVKKFNITYPVLLDNEHQTWRAYENQYWPAEYLIDVDGFLVHTHFGEGNYDETEKEIQKALKERNERLGNGKVIDEGIVQPKVEDINYYGIQTREIYFGYAFSRNQMGNTEGYRVNEIVDYSLPKDLDNNIFYMKGKWKNNPDNLASEENASITIKFHAKEIDFVAGSKESVSVSIYVDGNFVQNVTIKDHKLYTLYTGDDYADHTLELRAPKGIEAYTFTFG